MRKSLSPNGKSDQPHDVRSTSFKVSLSHPLPTHNQLLTQIPNDATHRLPRQVPARRPQQPSGATRTCPSAPRARVLHRSSIPAGCFIISQLPPSLGAPVSSSPTSACSMITRCPCRGFINVHHRDRARCAPRPLPCFSCSSATTLRV